MFTYLPNIWLVVAVAVVGSIIGSVWYSKFLFGPVWAALSGGLAQARLASRRNVMIFFGATLVEAYVAAHFVYYSGAYTFGQGAITGFWIWLGFLATTTAVGAAFIGQNLKLWAIDAGYQLVSVMVMCALLANW